MSFVLIGGIIGGCSMPQVKKEQMLERVDTLGFPSIPMSQTAFVPPDGDFVLLLPEKWFFVDLQRKGGSHILAVATNPEYTLQLVVAMVRTVEDEDRLYQEQGIVGVARAEFAQRYRKAGGTIRLVGKFQKKHFGLKEFGVYRFTNDHGATVHRVAVFRTHQGNFYSCSLIQSLFAQQLVPPESYCEQLFRSVLIALDFIQ